MKKSTRHSKLTGDFGEALILYWLSKNGYECARVDHTGIDIIAAKPGAKRRWGISVKCRSRAEGTENSYLGIPVTDFDKVGAACDAFGCTPFIALVIDMGQRVLAFILSVEYFKTIAPPRRRVSAWSMVPKRVNEYLADPKILSFELESRGAW
jgi:hypothetical protein